MTNEHFQTTATIAAFLSGVTATIMQFTYQLTTTPLENVVNSLLFSSLLFSLMSVINSLLFIKWYQSGRYASIHILPLSLLMRLAGFPLRLGFLDLALSSQADRKCSLLWQRCNLRLQLRSLHTRPVR